MNELLYILDDNNNTVPAESTDAWCTWVDTHDRTVNKTQIGDRLISTVFLTVAPLDDKFFETMEFYTTSKEQPDCNLLARYNTWDEAVAGHDQFVEKIKHEL